MTNAAKVHTYISKFTLVNTVTEDKMVHNDQRNYGRLNFIALKNYYEGVGVYVIDIVKANNII